MQDMVNISVGTGLITGLLGYAIVFVGLIALMLVVKLTSRIMAAGAGKAQPAGAVPAAAGTAAAVPAAPGAAGELKLYGTDERDAAMVMAIVADRLGKPLNELRFISIKEVREDEISSNAE